MLSSIKALTGEGTGITSDQSLWSPTQLWEEWSLQALWSWPWLFQVHLLGNSRHLTSMIFLANLKIWRSEPFLLIFFQLFYTNWKFKRTTSICRHKTVTSVIQRVKFLAWLDGKRSPTILTLTFLVHCPSAIQLAVMAFVNCQMSVHVKLDGKIFQVMTFTQNSLSWHNVIFSEGRVWTVELA